MIVNLKNDLINAKKLSLKIMKLSFLFLFIGINLCFSAETYSQRANFNFSLRNVTVKHVLNTIERNSDYVFFYYNNVIDLNRKVSINAKGKDIQGLLGELFAGTNNGFSITGRQISIFINYIKPNLDMTFVAEPPSKVIHISGVVCDKHRSPLPGVSIRIIGEDVTMGAITDVNGHFVLSIPSQNTVLELTSVGYKTKKIRVGNVTSFTILMEEDIAALNEVVVIGYGTQKKGMLTGSISSIKSEKLTNAPIANVTNMLVGQLPGLIAKQEAGLPGSDSSTLNIRGFGSPLIIVDGIESSMNNIDANQIASISVLKDGSASIYGARAGNGVILITTKHGSIQKPTVTVNSSYTLQGSTRINKPQNAGQRAQLALELYQNQEKPDESAPYTPDQIEKYFEGTDPHYPNTNWFKLAMRPYAPQLNQNISISGGSEKVKFYTYFGYNKQETIIRHDGGDYSRYNFQSNIDSEITKNLSLSVDVNSIYEDKCFSYMGLNGGANFWLRLYSSDSKYPSTLPDKSKYAYGGIPEGNIIAAGSTAINGYQKNRIRTNRLSGTIKYDVLQVPGLSLKAFFSEQEISDKMKEFRRQNLFYSYDIDTEQYTLNRGSDPTRDTETYSSSRQFTQQYSVNYENTFSNAHKILLLALFESTNYNGDYLYGSRANYMSTAVEQITAGDKTTSSADGTANEMGRASWIGRLNYSYKDKYLIETILRADASSKFPKHHRWGYFPSVSLGWVISEEPFMSKCSFLDNLKLRASYGESGNDAVSDYAYLSEYGFDGQYRLGDTTYTGLYVTGLANTALTWEKMKIYNGGIDFDLFKRKLYGSVDVFYRLRSGIPGTRVNSVPSSFGATLPTVNLNAINTRGFEILLGTSQKFNELSVDLTANITWARSKWDKYDEPVYEDADQERLYKLTDRWTNREFGYVSDGLFKSQEQIEKLPYVYSSLGNSNSTLRPGDVIYKDLNGDSVLDWKDQKEIGKGSTPNWIFGFNGTLRWKGFDASFLLQGAWGYSTNVDLQSVPTDFTYKHRWTIDNFDSKALVPRYGGASSNGLYSDFRLHNTAYVRMKNASIGYEIPQRIVNKVNIQKIRFYLAGTNLFTLSTLSKYGVDPEVSDGVSSVYYYPQQRTFSFGVNLEF